MRPTSRPDILVAILATATLATIVPAARAAGGEAPSIPTMTATVRLATDRTTFATGEPVTVHVTIANPGERRIAILRWRTPLDGASAPLFTVTRDGAPVRYLGRMVKRPAPTDADYVTLEPGASVTADVDLAKHYALDAPGRYVVAYDVESPQLYLPRKNNPPTDGHLTSEPLTIVVEGGAAAPRS